jgi:putative membrane protein
MLSVAVVFTALAALVHVYIFVLESLWWERPSTRAVFGTSAEVAATTRPLAYNQGFYNLFLAVGAAGGACLLTVDRGAAVALMVFSTGSMLAAALVLVTSDRRKARAALVQGLFPLIALLALLIDTL